MLDECERDKDGMPVPCRAVFIVGPDKACACVLVPGVCVRAAREGVCV